MSFFQNWDSDRIQAVRTDRKIKTRNEKVAVYGSERNREMMEDTFMEKYTYASLKERIKAEYRIYLLAFLFILIADSIGQIKIPLGPGNFISNLLCIDFGSSGRTTGDKDYEEEGSKGRI